MQRKVNTKGGTKIINPGLARINLSETGPRCNTPLHAAYLIVYSLDHTTRKHMGVPLSPSIHIQILHTDLHTFP